MHLVQQLMLPAPSGAGPPGHALDPAFSRKVFDRLTTMGRSAAARFNERR